MAEVPAAVEKELTALRGAVNAELPAKTSANLLVATWNLRAFAGLTTRWNSAKGDSPKRDWRSVTLIAEIVRRFDVIAVQEVRRETTALRFLLDRLGDDWRVITSDVTEGDAGNGERLTFVYDSTRVQPSGLVGEIVLPATGGKPVDQFARSPYAAGFRRGSVEFILTTVHIIWGDDAASRIPEMTAFANWMRAWADRPSDWNENLLVLGDFNLDRMDDPLFRAFISTGLWGPAELNRVPRTIFDDDRAHHFYDQIAWFSTPEGKSMLQSLIYNGSAGSFDFIEHTFAGMTKNEVSWRMSDHYPLWVEFDVNG